MTDVNKGSGITRREVLRMLGVVSAAGFAGGHASADGIHGNASRAAGDSQPLGVHSNWYYFSDENGEPLVLTGSHTWGRKRENKVWVSDGWDLNKFNKYLDFLEYWNHNYIRLWMWEQPGDIDIWKKTGNGKYDLSQLNQAFVDRTRSFVDAARSRGMYLGVMLFQGWSGTCPASGPDWPRHAMNRDNNINGVDGDPEASGFGARVHSLVVPEIVRFQEQYVKAMVEALSEYNNILWEIGNETIASSIPWMAHMVEFIRACEKRMPKQHLILTGTGNGVGNDSIRMTRADTFSPCVVTKWASPEDPFIANPPAPDEKLRKPILLDNDHLGNHFLRFTALDQRNWTWKSFTRGNHPLHMDCYDVFWDGESPQPDHPIPGVATHPHYDPQRKCLGDVRRFAARLNPAEIKPVSDPAVCSTTFCLAREGKEYLAYQPGINNPILLALPAGNYTVETVDTMDSKTEQSRLEWEGGSKTFAKPAYVKEDWALLVRRA